MLNRYQLPPITQKTIKREAIHQHHLGLHISKYGFDKKATFVVAPAGYGKTFFVKAWMAEQTNPVVWCSLKENTRETSQCLKQLILALKENQLISGEEMLAIIQENMLSSEEYIESYGMSEMLMNQLMGIEEPVFLVIEDYHTQKNILTHQLIIDLIHLLPTMVHLILITRFMPPFPLLQWQAKNSIQCITAAELKFSLNETVEFVECVEKKHLTHDQIKLIHEKSEGWITAIILYLLGLEMQTEAISTEEYLQRLSGNQEQILLLITEDFLSHFNDKTQEMLVKTSIFETFSESLLKVVFQSQELLLAFEKMKNYNIFLSPTDYGKNEFKYHYLLSALLGKKLKNYEKQELTPYHLKAIDYFKNESLYIDALKQAVSGNLHDEAAIILEENFHEILEDNGAVEVAEALDFIPQKQLDFYPILKGLSAFLKLVMLGRGEIDDQWFINAKCLGYDDSEKNRYYQGILYTIECLYAIYKDDLAKANRAAEKALELLPSRPSFWKMSISVMCGDIHVFSGQVLKGYHYYLNAHHENTLSHQPYFVISTGIKLAFSLRMMGRIQEMGEVLSEILQVIKEHGYQKSIKTGAVWAFYALYLYEIGEEKASERSLMRGKNLTAQYPLFYAWVLLIEIEMLVGKKAYQEAMKIVDELSLLERKSKLNAYISKQKKSYHAYLMGQMGLKEEAYQLFREAGIDGLKNIHPGNLEGLFLWLKLAMSEKDMNEKERKKSLDLFKKMAQESHQLQLKLMAEKLESLYQEIHYIEPLSAREKEILQLIAKGLSNQSISESLFLSISTVKWHTGNIYGKLGVKGRTQAVALANELDLI